MLIGVFEFSSKHHLSVVHVVFAEALNDVINFLTRVDRSSFDVVESSTKVTNFRNIFDHLHITGQFDFEKFFVEHGVRD